MMRAVGRGVKACVTRGVLAFGWGVPQDAGDEFFGAQGDGFLGVVAVVEVGHGHRAVVQVQEGVGGHRAALGVTGEIEHDTAAVVVGRADLDVPVLEPKRVQGGAPGVGGSWCRQHPGRAVQVRQRGQQLALKQPLQGLDGQEPVGATGAPGAVGVDAAGGDEAVDVGVVGQGAAPGVQRHEQAGEGPQDAGRGHQLQQGLAHAAHEHGQEAVTVELPERQQLVGQGEDDVEVRAGQQALQLCVDPARAGCTGAARTRAVAAGVELQLFDVAGGTRQDMGAHGTGAAVADALGGTQLARVQRARGGEGLEVLLEEGLLGHEHDGTAGEGSRGRQRTRAAQPLVRAAGLLGC